MLIYPHFLFLTLIFATFRYIEVAVYDAFMRAANDRDAFIALLISKCHKWHLQQPHVMVPVLITVHFIMLSKHIRE